MVLELGLQPQYVLDEIEIYEITALMRYSYLKHKDDWEQARLISYLIAQSNSTKKLKLEDIIKFQWDDESERHKDESTVTNDDIEQMMREADEIKRIMYED